MGEDGDIARKNTKMEAERMKRYADDSGWFRREHKPGKKEGKRGWVGLRTGQSRQER